MARRVVRHMHPFMAAESGEVFSLESSLTLGLVPFAIESEDVLDTLKSYVGKEVRIEGLVSQHLRAWNGYQGSPNRLYYWRTKYWFKEYLVRNNVHCLPVQDFLLNLTPLQQCLPINKAQRLGD